MRSAIVAGLLSVACAAALASAVEAHVYVKSRSPGKGATVSKNVGTVKITFTKQIISGSMTVKRKSNGRVVGSGGRSSASRVQASVGRLAAGRYSVKVRIVAGDGHRQSVSWSFEVRR